MKAKHSGAARMTRADVIYQFIIHAIVAVLVLLCVFPLIYVVLVSLTGEAEWIRRGNAMLIPYEPTFAGYVKVFRQSKLYVNALGISALRTVIGTGLTLSMTMLMGYIVSRERMPGNKGLMFLIMITVLFGGGVIPTYLVVNEMGMVDTFWAMIVPGLLDSWSVLVFRQFFRNLPHEIEESACVDGVGEVGLMIKIVAPMSMAVVAALGLFIAVSHWNAWYDALIYIRNDYLKPLQLILHNISTDANLGTNANDRIIDLASRVSTRTLRMCVTVMGAGPILCVYPFLQKYFVKGVYVGAVKG